MRVNSLELSRQSWEHNLRRYLFADVAAVANSDAGGCEQESQHDNHVHQALIEDVLQEAAGQQEEYLRQ